MSKLKHIAIATQDPESTSEFYRETLGLEMVGKVQGDNAEGYYLSDGNVNIAILKFKNEVVAGDQGIEYSGIHHIGFQVDDAELMDSKLKKSNFLPKDDINKALHAGSHKGGRGKNVETKYSGPDGVMIDISQGGWVGTD